jgi:hypothetical protein
VLVYVHGGGFQEGTTREIRPEVLARKYVQEGIVFVTFQYRIGQLGILYYSLKGIIFSQKDLRQLAMKNSPEITDSGIRNWLWNLFEKILTNSVVTQKE